MPVASGSSLTVSLIVSVLVALASPTDARSASAQKPEGSDNWADFVHYVRIALPQRAAEHAEHLLEVVGDDNDQLLTIVEQGPYPLAEYERDLTRAMKFDSLVNIATRLSQRIQEAKIGRIRDKQRIVADIQRLRQGKRAQANAMERLKAAGQFAAPLLLEALQSEKPQNQQLHPRILAAIVQIGRPLVYPLAESLAQLEPVQMGQVAQALTEIGYTLAAPYIKEVLESTTLDTEARAKVQRAYNRLATNVHLPDNVSAAELYLTLGENVYDVAARSVPGYDPKMNKGIVWSYNPQIGLVQTAVPPQVFGDVLAMRAAKRALRLNPNMNRAVSLWLTANLRRENRLADRETDPSYGASMRPPRFYAVMAGPLRQHDVLLRALEDADVALALDAIDALDATAGTDSLVNRKGAIQPLLDALSYPDRRVRFAAAFALTHARPKARFPGSYRVVPILAEAVRQAGVWQALVIARNDDSRNKLVDTIKQLADFQAMGGLTLQDQAIADLIAVGPGVDLIVTDLGAALTADLLRTTSSDFRLGAAPILALVPKSDQIELKRQFSDSRRLFWDDSKLAGDPLAARINQVIESSTGKPISQREANRYAARSIELLRQIALSRGEVFHIQEAQSALIAALKDSRQSIAQQAATVLALLESATSQRALADTAMDKTRPTNLRISLLQSLAQSAKHFGNSLQPPQIEAVLDLVRTSDGDLAIAAARAHGALTLPASHLRKMLID